jgi:hypothetical protein
MRTPLAFETDFPVQREEHDLKWLFALIGFPLFIGHALAQEHCPVEVKILLSSPDAQPAIAALGFRKSTQGEVYFFDTKSLDLLAQGAIVRIRQGANDDLTVKLRPPEGKPSGDRSQLGAHFPCEIDRTRTRADTSYAVERPYKVATVPSLGTDIFNILNASQKNLLVEAGVSIDWARVVRIVSIHTTKWQTGTQSPYGKLALELWEWPAGKILEISSKAPANSDESKYADLAQLLEMHGLSLNANQDTKTTTVLKTLGKSSRGASMTRQE